MRAREALESLRGWLLVPEGSRREARAHAGPAAVGIEADQKSEDTRTHTHTHTHARTHARTHTHIHTAGGGGDRGGPEE